MTDVSWVVDEAPIELKAKAKRLRSLDEFEAPYWKGLFQPWRREAVPIGIIGVGFAIGVAIGILLLT